ncbi:MAG: hypothetical protein A2163_04070 [Actinobacteria bacterium RBG_13_35_12]|nr:MAG: hypothetical protein A2163_04070 [Actinobacteria bacterium RBG_13_35_12]
MVETKEITKVKIDFNEPHITYKDSNEQKVVGVTTAIEILAKPALIPWAYKRGRDGLELYESRDKAANVGTIVHARIMAYFLGYEIDNSNISPEVWKITDNSLLSFYEWARPRKVKSILVETPLVSDKYKYGGTPDVYGEMDDKLTLLDFKTGSGIYPDFFVQVAAYSKLLIENGYPHEKIIILNIPKSEGDSFQVQQVSVDSLELQFKKFMHCVEIYYLDKEIKIKKTGGV